MLKLHHLNNSRSQRVLWMLEELGVDYELIRYERNAKTMLAPPELKAIHPLGKSPVLTDGDLVIAESAVILEYLVGKYGKGGFVPAEGTPEKLRYTYWMHYAEGSLMPLLLLKLVMTQVEKSPMPFFVKPIAKRITQSVNKAFIGPNLETHLGFIESELAKSAFFAGNELTAADVQMSFPVEAATTRAKIDAKSHPKLFDFLDSIHGRPAYRRALKKGGEYKLG